MILYLGIFISGGLFGWLVDTAYRTWEAKRYTSGTMVPFFSIIFGVAAVLLYILFNFLSVSVYLDIAIGTIICILLELVCGMLAPIFLKRRFWDYSAKRFNFRGIIDIEHFFYWLILTGLYRILYPFLF